MKRATRILLTILFIVPMLFGMCFLSPNLVQNNAQTTQNGGGGGKPSKSPETGQNDPVDTDINDDSKGEKQTDVWRTPTYKTYEDFFTDLNITKETISSLDYTGSGTESDPYVVHSTKGFLYLTNKKISGILLNSKYLELDCDITLNEEKFDKNGNVLGGDGVVYNWLNTNWNCYHIRIDGNGNSIYGFCGIEFDETKTGFKRNLFTGQHANVVKDLKMENLYIDGRQCNNVFGITYSIGTISGCSVSGYINSGKSTSVASICCKFDDYAENCTNYADIYSTGEQVTGLFYEVNAKNSQKKKIINCNNYGNIRKETNAGNGRVAGIVYNLNNAIMTDCNNYGEIYAEVGQVGGIASWAYNASIIRCNNYGDITATGQSGGIVGFVSYNKTMVIDSCNNFGKTNAKQWGFGEIVGYVRCVGESVTPVVKMTIKNCQVGSYSGLCMIGNARAEILQIENCKIDYYGHLSSVTVLQALFYDTNESSNIEISNCEVNVYDKTIKQVRLWSSIYTKTNIKVKNILVNVMSDVNFVPYSNLNEKYYDYLEGIVVCGKNYFYGEDFSGYYVDFKTGKIGLRSMNGKGFFQGKVDESVLISKGFTKKELTK